MPETYRECRKGNHSQCTSNVCGIRAELEKKARACVYSRLILDYCEAKNIPWETLGADEKPLREYARFSIPKWLAPEFKSGYQQRIEAKYLAEGILKAKPTERTVFFDNPEDDEDDFDPDDESSWGA